jgi:hypothetical protein
MLLASLLSGCGPDFDPASLLTTLRVVAIKTEPPEVSSLSDTVVSASSLVYIPATATTQPFDYTWKFCAFPTNSQVSFACLIPNCETEIASGPDQTSLTWSGAAAVNACLATYYQLSRDINFPAGFKIIDETTEYIDTFLKLSLSRANEPLFEAVKRIRFNLKTSSPSAFNRNPSLTNLSINGTIIAEGQTARYAASARLTIEISLADDSLQSYRDSDGNQVSEEPFFSWFSDAGEWELDRSYGNGRTNWLNLPADNTLPEITIIVVARDGRGGVDWIRRTIGIKE